MIKKLQIKFIMIIMVIMFVVLIAIFGAINYTMYRTGEQQSVNMMNEIAKMDGNLKAHRPPYDRKGPPFKMPMPQAYFSVKVDINNQILEIISDDKSNYTKEEITEMTNLVLTEEVNKIDGLRTLVDGKKPYGKIVVFMDRAFEQNVAYRLIFITIVIGLAGLLLIFVVSIYLSAWAIAPVKKSYESQRQFVADASHELKTPLAVITANADVIKGEIGENKWLEYIIEETDRMNGLVDELLYLARNDSDELNLEMNNFNLSNALMSVCLPFESIAYESGKELHLDLGEDIWVFADEKRIKQVAVILMDNAFKHTDNLQKISSSLKRAGTKTALSVSDTGHGIEESEKDKIFERFYRSDSSRTKETGGYGLGLSIAKTIVERHKGKIYVESQVGKGTTFTVTF